MRLSMLAVLSGALLLTACASAEPKDASGASSAAPSSGQAFSVDTSRGEATVTYRGQVQGGVCEPTGKCDPGVTPPPFVLRMAGIARIILESDQSLRRYLGKQVQVTGVVPVHSGQESLTLRVETIQEVR